MAGSSIADANPTETPTPGVTPFETPTPGKTPFETPTPGITPLFTSDQDETPTPGITPLPSITPLSEESSDSDSDMCQLVRASFKIDVASPVMEDMVVKEKENLEDVSPVMEGIVKKKGKVTFRNRFYTLTSDGNLYSARDDQGTKKKHIVNFEEQTSILSVRERDLIITGQNEQGPVSIKLRFNDAEERAAWLEAFNKIILKEQEKIDDEIDPPAEAVQENAIRCCDGACHVS